MKQKTKRQQQQATWAWVKIVFFSLLVALVIRFFFFEVFRMPSAQMENTVFAGEFVGVNKAAYGMRVPYWADGGVRMRYGCFREVKRNDIIIYYYDRQVMMSRCLGLPGDTLEVKQGDYYINGAKMPQNPDVIEPYQYLPQHDSIVSAVIRERNLPLRQHAKREGMRVRFLSKYEYYLLSDALPDSVTVERFRQNEQEYKVVIPPKEYWLLSDNIKASADSRHYGFIPHECLIGRASFVLFSKDPTQGWLDGYRWTRFFKSLGK